MATFQHSMTPAEYLAALDRLGFAQTGLESDAGISAAGRFFGVAPRTGRAWAVDGPPNPVAVCLRLMLAEGTLYVFAVAKLETKAAYPLGPKARRKR